MLFSEMNTISPHKITGLPLQLMGHSWWRYKAIFNCCHLKQVCHFLVSTMSKSGLDLNLTGLKLDTDDLAYSPGGFVSQ